MAAAGACMGMDMGAQMPGACTWGSCCGTLLRSKTESSLQPALRKHRCAPTVACCAADVGDALRERGQRIYAKYGTLMLNTEGMTLQASACFAAGLAIMSHHGGASRLATSDGTCIQYGPSTPAAASAPAGLPAPPPEPSLCAHASPTAQRVTATAVYRHAACRVLSARPPARRCSVSCCT